MNAVSRTRRASHHLCLAYLPFGIALIASMISSPALRADDAKYLVPEPLPRVALLIGAQEYTYLNMLPNIGTDLDALYEAFDRLGFTDILVVTNPCQRDIYNAIDALEQRVRAIAPDGGATVVVFFAGHGAMNGHEQYVIPKDFDERLLGTYEHYQIAVPVSHLEEKLKSLMTGAGIVIVDACRTNFPPPELNPTAAEERPECTSGTAVWMKASVAQVARIGVRAPQQIPYVALAYSTRPGLEAAAFMAPNKPSSYVAALKAQLEGGGAVVPDLFAHAYNDILTSSAKDLYPLQPVFQQNGLVRAYLWDDPKQVQEQTERWHTALGIGAASRSAVENYVKGYPTGRFLRAALLWLKDHPKPQPDVPVIAGEFRAMEVPQFSWTLPKGLVLRRFPTNVAVSARVSQSRDVLLRSGDSRGEWLEIVGDEASAKPRFVRADDLGLRATDLPPFWTQDDAIDVTSCTQRGVEAVGCLLSFRDRVTPNATEVANVLSIEDPEADAAEGVPSAVAFGRALDIQVALGELGVPIEQTSMNVVPRSFAPALSGRVIVKLSPRKE